MRYIIGRNKKGNISIIILSLVMCISFLCGCGEKSYENDFYNNDNKLCKQADNYNFVFRSENTFNNKSSVKFGTFYGMETIFTIDAKEGGKITLNYEAKIDSGKFKTVLISQDDKVTTIFEGDSKKEETIEVNKGTNRIKIVGNNAKGNFKMDITLPDTMKIKNRK